MLNYLFQNVADFLDSEERRLIVQHVQDTIHILLFRNEWHCISYHYQHQIQDINDLASALLRSYVIKSSVRRRKQRQLERLIQKQTNQRLARQRKERAFQRLFEMTRMNDSIDSDSDSDDCDILSHTGIEIIEE